MHSGRIYIHKKHRRNEGCHKWVRYLGLLGELQEDSEILSDLISVQVLGTARLGAIEWRRRALRDVPQQSPEDPLQMEGGEEEMCVGTQRAHLVQLQLKPSPEGLEPAQPRQRLPGSQVDNRDRSREMGHSRGLQRGFYPSRRDCIIVGVCQDNHPTGTHGSRCAVQTGRR